MAGLKVCVVNFWPSFSAKTGAVGAVLDQAFGAYELVARPEDADVVFTSIFAKQERTAAFRDKSIAVIWENFRPDYFDHAYSLSTDFDSYGGRNCRFPCWYGQLMWPGMTPDAPTGTPPFHGYEPPVDIDTLLRPRPSSPRRELFCCFIASNPEQHRRLALEGLATVGRIDIYGAVVQRPLAASKYTIMPRYRFALCFENSLFPGYYTEKALHAWMGGCVPLYYGDRWLIHDFNPQALINRADFPTIAAFADHVGKVDRDPGAFASIVGQPLLLRRPSLDPIVDFVKRAAKQIVESAPTRQWPGVTLQ